MAIATPNRSRNPDITVIIPVYNGEAYIAEAIESVLSQRGCVTELIVVDDGSTDKTVDCITSYNKFLRYCYQTNQGVSAARNAGLELARGRFIAFLDADDYFLPDKLAQQWEVIKSNPNIGIVHSGWQRVDRCGRLLSQVCPWEQFPSLDLATWLLHKPVLPSAMMFARHWLEQVNGFDQSMTAAEDVDLVLRMAIAGCQSQWLPKVTTAYRQHGNSAMGNGLVQAASLKRLLDKTFAHPALPPRFRLMERQVRNGTLVWAAWYLYRTGYGSEMAQLLQEIFRESRQLPMVLLVQWAEAFVQFSADVGETFDVEDLLRSPHWQLLQNQLIGAIQLKSSSPQ